MNWRKRDWRKVKSARHPDHLVMRWFHWSKRPRLYLHYWDSTMLEMRYMKVNFTECVRKGSR